MKMISWNIKGIGNEFKRRELKGRLDREKPDFVCVQGTKKEMIQARLCQAIWGSTGFDWAFRASSGRLEGMLCIWNSSMFHKSSVCEGEGFLYVKGIWGNSNFPCAIVNIYSP